MTSTDLKPSNKIQVDKAICFIKLMRTKEIVQYIQLLQDVCNALKKLSLTLQKRDASLIDVHRSLKTTCIILEKYLVRYD